MLALIEEANDGERFVAILAVDRGAELDHGRRLIAARSRAVRLADPDTRLDSLAAAA